MPTIETTAILEDRARLRLTEPLQQVPTGPVRVILIFPEEAAAAPQAWPPGFLDAAYGSCKDDPLELPSELPYEANRPPLAP